MAPLRTRSWLLRHLPTLSAVAVVLGVVVVVLSQLHPDLLLTNSTTTGGDTGAHVALPAFLKAHLLPWHLTGWYPGWYDGFPLYTYYFVLPDLIAALLAYVIPYGIAFKLATILGSLLMPLCAYLMGRLFRLKDPIPAALAVVTLPFLFDTTFTIDGGNLFSTLAGEYSFSLSLALSFVVIGLFARGTRTGKGSLITPIVMALCLAAHLVPFLYAATGVAAVILWSLLPDHLRHGDDAQGSPVGLLGGGDLSRVQSLLWSARAGLLGLALSAWWLVPFVAGRKYTNPMGYVNDTDYLAKLFPRADLWVVILALIALGLAVRQMSRFGLVMAFQAVIWGIAFVVDPQGALWNERMLPFFYMSLYLLAGWGIGFLVAALARWYRRDRLERYEIAIGEGILRQRPEAPRWLPGAVVGPLMILLLGLAVVVPPLTPGFISPSTLSKVGIHVGANQVSSWASWNYSGYEAKPAYPEFNAIMKKMSSLASTYGCGRAMWEYNSSLNRFGTPMALMLLPYFTNNCVGSQEGLFFESSPTVPFHFLIQSEVSQSPSNPQVNLPYAGLDVAKGVSHLQMLGVKYLMLSSPDVIKQADSMGQLTKIGTVGPYAGQGSGVTSTTWSIYFIHSSALVTGLTHLPVVVPGIAKTVDSWKNANVAWFENPNRWSVPLAASGPSSWPVGTSETTTSPAVGPVVVSKIATTTSTVSFHVDKVGVPVVVRVSYYPRWHVAGATGPYRISPDLMVVVPTAHDVTLTYGADATVLTGLGVTAAALVGLVATLVIERRRRRTTSLRGIRI